MIQVILFSRPGCHLCEQTLQDLTELKDRYPFRLEVLDIDSDSELKKRFDLEVPVVQIGPYLLKAPFTRQELEITLSAQADRDHHIQRIKNPPEDFQTPASKIWSRSDGFTYWIAKHYLAMFNLFVLIYVGLPFLAPVMMKSGAEAPARVIYKAYSAVCHQLAFRSFFLFGEQPVYPRAAAGVNELKSFAEATGMSEGNYDQDILAARFYVGEINHEHAIGYKVALCERDIAIYASILLFGLVYALTGRRLPPLPWYLWILFALAPIGLDGFSQILSQPPLNLLPYRESTPFLRVLTGALFGFGTAWFGYPLVEETMAETRQVMADKWERIHPVD
jgi:uncharacterized membrane protein